MMTDRRGGATTAPIAMATAITAKTGKLADTNTALAANTITAAAGPATGRFGDARNKAITPQ